MKENINFSSDDFMAHLAERGAKLRDENDIPIIGGEINYDTPSVMNVDNPNEDVYTQDLANQAVDLMNWKQDIEEREKQLLETSQVDLQDLFNKEEVPVEGPTNQFDALSSVMSEMDQENDELGALGSVMNEMEEEDEVPVSIEDMDPSVTAYYNVVEQALSDPEHYKIKLESVKKALEDEYPALVNPRMNANFSRDILDIHRKIIDGINK